MKKEFKIKILALVLFFSLNSYTEGEHKIFNLGNFDLESGVVLPNAKLSYVTHGELNKEKDNLIFVPSAYLGDHHGFDLIRKGYNSRSTLMKHGLYCREQG